MAEIRTREDAHLRNTVSDKSRYFLTLVTLDEVIVKDRRRFGIWKKPDIKVTIQGEDHIIESGGIQRINSSDAIRHVILPAEVGNIDLIAKIHYNDENLWWAIALVNKIRNPMVELRPGDTLLIPQKEAIAEALAQRESKR
jgi:hypothetical protein